MMYLPGTTDLFLNKAARSWRGWRQPARGASTSRSSGWQGWFRQLAEWARRSQPGDEPEEAHRDIYFEHLLDTVNPHTMPKPGGQARVLAGRWIALRRIHLGKTQAELALITGVATTALLLLETGLGKEDLATPESWEILASELGTSSSDSMAAPAEEVLALALSRGETVDQQLLAQVVADLGPRIGGGDTIYLQWAPAAFGSNTGAGHAAKPRGGAASDAAETGIVLLFIVLVLLTLFVLVAPPHGPGTWYESMRHSAGLEHHSCCEGRGRDRDALWPAGVPISGPVFGALLGGRLFLQENSWMAGGRGRQQIWNAPALPLRLEWRWRIWTKDQPRNWPAELAQVGVLPARSA